MASVQRCKTNDSGKRPTVRRSDCPSVQSTRPADDLENCSFRASSYRVEDEKDTLPTSDLRRGAARLSADCKMRIDMALIVVDVASTVL